MLLAVDVGLIVTIKDVCASVLLTDLLPDTDPLVKSTTCVVLVQHEPDDNK